MSNQRGAKSSKRNETRNRAAIAIHQLRHPDCDEPTERDYERADAALTSLADEPKHEARPPHPDTMAGR